MFQVQRFDPRQEEIEAKRRRRDKNRSSSLPSSTAKQEKKHRKKKRKLDNDDKSGNNIHRSSTDDDTITAATTTTATKASTSSNLRIVAPVTDGAISKPKSLKTALSAEAFDDLDVYIDTGRITHSETAGGDLVTYHQLPKRKKQQKENEKHAQTEQQHDSLEEEYEGTKDDDDDGFVEFDPTDEIERALQMSSPDLPIEVAAKRWGLSSFLVSNLKRDGYKHFFPIQALVIPDVIVAERHMGGRQTYDIMCAAPTGSGKTLAFVLPLLNALSHRRVRRLRALVILPSRDLAQQVHDVFERYTHGSPNNLKIGLAIGQTDFKAEQQHLLFGKEGKQENKSESGRQFSHQARLRSAMDKGNVNLALNAMEESLHDTSIGIFSKTGVTNTASSFLPDVKACIPSGGVSGIDVLVCTPGRLVDHLDNTPGFTLQHLRWLVIDEADRLMSQSYHGWIHRVLDNVNAAPVSQTARKSNENEEIRFFDPITFRRTATDNGRNSIYQRVQLRKLLYSATLTKDPQKLAALQLVNPKYFNVNHLDAARRRKQKRNGDHGESSADNALYRLPDKLNEYTVECTAEQKPIVLLALLLERLEEAARAGKMKHLIVVFTSSLESTHRLTRLLQLLWLSAGYGAPPMEYSSALNQHQRSHLMQRCNDPRDSSVNVLVCSDGMSRGMDLNSVRTVIHYDIPGMAKTYVHRCGRTARAGQHGEAIALLKGKGQTGQFSRLRSLIANSQDRITAAKIKLSLVHGAIPLYKECIVCLKEVLAAENRQELKHTDSDLSKWLPSSPNDVESDASDDSIDDDGGKELSTEGDD